MAALPSSPFISAQRVEQHVRTGFGPAHMLLLLHPPVHQLVDSRTRAVEIIVSEVCTRYS